MPAVPNVQDIRKSIPALGTSTWVAIIGLLAAGLLLAIHFGFRPVNLK